MPVPSWREGNARPWSARGLCFGQLVHERPSEWHRRRLPPPASTPTPPCRRFHLGDPTGADLCPTTAFEDFNGTFCEGWGHVNPHGGLALEFCRLACCGDPACGGFTYSKQGCCTMRLRLPSPGPFHVVWAPPSPWAIPCCVGATVGRCSPRGGEGSQRWVPDNLVGLACHPVRMPFEVVSLLNNNSPSLALPAG